MSATWRGSEGREQPPRFGARGRAWLRARLARDLPVRVEVGSAPERVPHLVNWYVARWVDVVTWVPTDDYRGRGYAAGAWQIQWARVLEPATLGAAWRAAGEAAAEARARLITTREADARGQDAARFPTLDAWLDAERRGALAADGVPEPRVTDLLRGNAGWRVVGEAAARRDTWPRPCATCGASFRPERRKGVRCASCRAAARGAATPAVDPSCAARSERRPRGAA